MTSQVQSETLPRNELINPAAAGISLQDLQGNYDRRSQARENESVSGQANTLLNINFGIMMRVNSNQGENENFEILDNYEDISSTYPETRRNMEFEYTTSHQFFSSVNNNFFVVN